MASAYKTIDDSMASRLDIDELIVKILSVGHAEKSMTKTVKEQDLMALCNLAKKSFLLQPVMVEVEAPIKVCGDVHGQYSDVIRLFNIARFPPHSNYIFLGDYVDRGRQNLELITLFLCYKIKFFDRFYMLRGNHECPAVNRVYGFYEECNKRYASTRLWLAFQEAFAAMPFTGLVSGRILCMHGGLSPKLTNIDALRELPRPMDPPSPSLHIDLLWSDPDNSITDWAPNALNATYSFHDGQGPRELIDRHILHLSPSTCPESAHIKALSAIAFAYSVTMVRYCPLGQPALLTGDFYENVARIPDFSWSVLLSSNPNTGSHEKSVGGEIVEYFWEHPLFYVAQFAFISLYTLIYGAIVYKCFSCVKRTRNTLMNVVWAAALLSTMFSAFLIFFRVFSFTIFIFAVMIFYHLLIPCMVIHYACDASIRPSMKEYPSFRLPGLKVFFLLTAVLVFFFAPGVSTPSDVCPPKIERVCSEIYFWTIFPYLFFSFASIKYLVYACQTKTFYLLENKTIIGEIKEKEGFGWITHIDEEKKPVVVSQ
ncbi:hypothetical protein L3Y34_001216 [Caenorhabditis briggsae]|uniref:Serine/threonine-protein phosphatase n=2 Tax=Caenorhabditis briggsae TaxID=6238 RepID=A0AAE9DBG5_CAEBR|nr:hypothetical protein L3Y34_001216 [Caenorhabditis briggsae]